MRDLTVLLLHLLATLARLVGPGGARVNVSSHRWQPHCRGLYQTPVAA